ncbi:NADH-quinone oxidoreductase subunit C [Nocardioides sp. Leaf285]|uniref:NADH-quinone oxidoreductase subunit C n=1 Tax=Nocardioides sp. Leaf285 TaxID=1736322 RepID=UPI000702876B|nr:NADH-quinone oxidoreductase subunit C [Nocardioides sp. Leaf285]KQP63391.1 NADH dehydrogenase [Nocardioides sp. Leaf285]
MSPTDEPTQGGARGTVDQAATDQSPENLPAPPEGQPGSQTVRQVGERRGMFGVKGSGDTSGYGGLRAAVRHPAATARPFGGWFDEVADALEVAARGAGVERAVESVVVHRGEITFHVRPDDLLVLARLLRDEPRLRFELLSSVSGVHCPADAGHELHVVHHLLSMTHNRRIRLEVAVPDTDPRLPSLVPVYPTADWHERETWDMFGVLFEGHPSLTRILMPDDWPGHPQRKDYPLGGIPVEYKGGTVPPPDQRRSYS